MFDEVQIAVEFADSTLFRNVGFDGDSVAAAAAAAVDVSVSVVDTTIDCPC